MVVYIITFKRVLNIIMSVEMHSDFSYFLPLDSL